MAISPMLQKISISEQIPTEMSTDSFFFRMQRLSNGSYVAYLITYGPVVPIFSIRYHLSLIGAPFGLDGSAWKHESHNGKNYYYWNFTYYNVSKIMYILGYHAGWDPPSAGYLQNNSYIYFVFPDSVFGTKYARIEFRLNVTNNAVGIDFFVKWEKPSFSGGTKVIYYAVLSKNKEETTWQKYTPTQATANSTTGITTTIHATITTVINGTTVVLTTEIESVITGESLVVPSVPTTTRKKVIVLNLYGIVLMGIGLLGMFATRSRY
ncbi:MAG: hypothetical protein Q6363_007805 [Candidatus Njordarchaeota archaeon]